MYNKNKKIDLSLILAMAAGIAFSLLFLVIAIGNDKPTEDDAETASESAPIVEVVESAETAENPEATAEPDLSYLDTEEVRLYEALSPEKKSVITRYAQQTGVDESLVLAICYHESRFKPTLTHENANGTTDWGIAQCNDSTFEVLQNYIGIKDMSELLDFETGVRACCALLQYYKNRGLEETTDILLAYQQGYGGYEAVKSGNAEPWAAYAETIDCMDIYEKYFSYISMN